MERIAVALELKTLAPNGSFVGLASTYGNVDEGGDVVDRGAFSKTLAERGSTVPILWQHDQRCPIGRGLLKDTTAGLQITGQLSIGTTLGRDAYELLKDGVISGLSIGYDAVKSANQGGVRHLKEIKLYECSLVTFPMNTEAQISSVKQRDEEIEALRALNARMKRLIDAPRPAPQSLDDIVRQMRANYRRFGASL